MCEHQVMELGSGFGGRPGVPYKNIRDCVYGGRWSELNVTVHEFECQGMTFILRAETRVNGEHPDPTFTVNPNAMRLVEKLAPGWAAANGIELDGAFVEYSSEEQANFIYQWALPESVFPPIEGQPDLAALQDLLDAGQTNVDTP